MGKETLGLIGRMLFRRKNEPNLQPPSEESDLPESLQPLIQECKKLQSGETKEVTVSQFVSDQDTDRFVYYMAQYEDTAVQVSVITRTKTNTRISIYRY
jgi:hypothetical protein